MTDQWLSSDEQAAWRAYLGLHRELSARLHRQLQVDSQLSLTDYEVLVVLSEAPDGRMRPFAMVEALQWEQSRLSHHVSRMQRRGLVVREECTADGRGAFIVLTPCGRAAIEAAAPAHAAKVRQLFFDAFTPEQLAVMTEISALAMDRMGAADANASACPSKDCGPDDSCPGEAVKRSDRQRLDSVEV